MIKYNHVTGLCHRKRVRALGMSVKGSDAPFSLAAPLEQMIWIEDNQSLAYPNTRHTQSILTLYDDIVTVQIPMQQPKHFEDPFYADPGIFPISHPFSDEQDLFNNFLTFSSDEWHSRVLKGGCAFGKNPLHLGEEIWDEEFDIPNESCYIIEESQPCEYSTFFYTDFIELNQPRPPRADGGLGCCRHSADDNESPQGEWRQQWRRQSIIIGGDYRLETPRGKRAERWRAVADEDNINDGQEINGYQVTISWYEGENLKSKDITVYGDPMGAYKDPNGNYLDVDGDGIYDIDEIDPVNSTRLIWYFDTLKNDKRPQSDKDELVQNQFNPYIKETIPPKIENIDIKTSAKIKWKTYLFVPYPVVKHCWSKIKVEISDVSEFTVTVKVKDNGKYVTFTGQGNEVFEATIDIDYLKDYLVDYRVKIVASDVSGNEIEWEKKINGIFGGFLDVLNEIWNVIAGAFTAAFELMVAALNFLVDLIIDMVKGMIDAVLAPIVNAMNNWVKSVGLAIDEAFEEHSPSRAMIDPEGAAESIWGGITSGTFFYALMALSIAIIAIQAILVPYTPIAAPFLVLLEFFPELIFNAFVGMFLSYGVTLLAGGITRAVLYMVYPEGNQFWQESAGIGVMSIVLPISVLLTVGAATLMDAFLLGFSLLALAITILAGDNIVWGVIGFFIAMVGAIWTFKNTDIFDIIGSPFSKIEEILALISIGIALTNVL
jgi:hypothetical protein